MDDFPDDEEFVEFLLSFETRMLAMPDGSIRPITKNQLFWGKFNYLMKVQPHWAPPKICELAIRDAKETGRDFDTSFEHVAGYASQHAYKLWGDVHLKK